MTKTYKLTEDKLLFLLYNFAASYIHGTMKHAHGNCDICYTIYPPDCAGDWILRIWATPRNGNNNAEEVAKSLCVRTCVVLGKATSDVKIKDDGKAIEASIKFEL